MAYTETYIAQLLLKQLSGGLTPDEELALQEWRSLSANNNRLYEDLLNPSELPSRLQDYAEAAVQAAGVQAPAITIPADITGGGRVRFFQRNWLKYAAILLIILGAGLFFLTKTRNIKPVIANLTPAPTEIPAAGYKATLTLSDGTIIPLDSTVNGTIAQQGNAAIVKMPDGEIRYDLKGASSKEVMTNTMSTPKGGQYRLTLPDGSKVWLNAASSITYPAAFVTNIRNIKITGEVYIEVAHDKTKPFIVDVDGYGTVEALGTSFNINAYKDHGTLLTTLVTGKVRVAGKNDQAAAKNAVVLSPGQQAIQEAGVARSPEVITGANLQQVLAWKNGIFDLTGATFQNLMKEVERWYNVDVKYEGTVPDLRFKGKMDRAVKLSGVIRFLKDYNIDAQLDGRTLIIKNK